MKARARDEGREHTRKALPIVEGGHMVPTEGDRDDGCASYRGCLEAHLKAHKGHRGDNSREIPASCPTACRWRTEATKARATDYISINGACHGVGA